MPAKCAGAEHVPVHDLIEYAVLHCTYLCTQQVKLSDMLGQLVCDRVTAWHINIKQAHTAAHREGNASDKQKSAHSKRRAAHSDASDSDDQHDMSDADDTTDDAAHVAAREAPAKGDMRRDDTWSVWPLLAKMATGDFQR